MRLDDRFRALGPLCKRAPLVPAGVALLLLLGILAGFQELRIMALLRNTHLSEDSECESSTRVAGSDGMKRTLSQRDGELPGPTLVSDELADEGADESGGARSQMLSALAASGALVLLMAVVPGALIFAGTYRLVRDSSESEARLQAAFNFSLHPMIVTDARGTIQSASESVKSVFGWDPEEIVGQSVTILMPVPFRKVHDDKVAAHFASGRETLIGKPRELEAVRRDGTTFPCMVTLWKAPLPGRDSYLLMAIITDITDQKANEAKIAELNRQVVVAARQAGKAEIATNVLHNVGNVLSSVNVASSLIRETLKSGCYEDMSRVSHLVTTHSERLDRFISEDPRGQHLPLFLVKLFNQLRYHRDDMERELLSLEKSIEHINAIVESQQQYARGISRVIEPTDVSEIVADAVRISEASLTHHGIAVEVYSRPMPMVLLDEQKFLHVMVNLIGNARHACMESPTHEKWVKIWVEHEDDHVSVKVQDNGVGIDPAVIKQIFNHGFTTRKGGHGFGLHSVALAIEESCGKIEVYSAGPGRGATFLISMPVVTAVQQSAARSEWSASNSPSLPVSSSALCTHLSGGAT